MLPARALVSYFPQPDFKVTDIRPIALVQNGGPLNDLWQQNIESMDN